MKTPSARAPLLMHFEFQPQVFDAPFPESLTTQIELMQWIGCQVRVTKLKSHIASGVIGYLSCYDEETLLFREELRKQLVVTEKETIVSQRIYQSPLQDAVSAACNN